MGFEVWITAERLQPCTLNFAEFGFSFTHLCVRSAPKEPTSVFNKVPELT
jgi:hypothetical protein